MSHVLVFREDGVAYCATCANTPAFTSHGRCPREEALRALAEKWRAIRERVQREKSSITKGT